MTTARADAPPRGRVVADRLAETAHRTFVGREIELDQLIAAARATPPPFVVAFVRGPGGIGKTRLLGALAHRIGRENPATQVVRLDCRDVEPTPRRFLEALATSTGQPLSTDPAAVAAGLAGAGEQGLLLLDTYETLGLLDTWLRQEFLPQLPETVLTVIAGREAPSAGWSTAPGWQGLVRDIALAPLADQDALRFLRARGLDPARAEEVNRFARGYPLALELAVIALRREPDLEIAAGPSLDVLAQLLRALLGGLSAEQIAAVEGLAVVRRATEPVLEALLPDADAGAVYATLRDLPFVTAGAEGLVLHDLVRDAIAGDLQARDPDRYHTYRARAATYFREVADRPRVDSLWSLTADLFYLIKNPLLRSACFPEGGGEHSIEPSGAADGAAILAIADAHETPAAAALMHRWWRSHPTAFRIARNHLGGVDGFFILAERGAVDPELLAEDPIAAAWERHLAANPLAAGERVLLYRRWLARDFGEDECPARQVLWLDVKRSYMELRPRLRRLYASISDLAGIAPTMGPLGFAPLAGEAVDLDGQIHHPAVLEFGPRSVDGWLAGLIDAEVAAEPALAAAPTAGDAGGDGHGLTARELEVLALVADGHTDRAIGERLHISEKTVGRHLANVFAKLGVHTRVQATRVAIAQELVAAD